VALRNARLRHKWNGRVHNRSHNLSHSRNLNRVIRERRTANRRGMPSRNLSLSRSPKRDRNRAPETSRTINPMVTDDDLEEIAASIVAALEPSSDLAVTAEELNDGFVEPTLASEFAIGLGEEPNSLFVLALAAEIFAPLEY
jgi:hypothetical protein